MSLLSKVWPILVRSYRKIDQPTHSSMKFGHSCRKYGQSTSNPEQIWPIPLPLAGNLVNPAISRSKVDQSHLLLQVFLHLSDICCNNCIIYYMYYSSICCVNMNWKSAFLFSILPQTARILAVFREWGLGFPRLWASCFESVPLFIWCFGLLSCWRMADYLCCICTKHIF